jgi:chromosome segregation ATPase
LLAIIAAITGFGVMVMPSWMLWLVVGLAMASALAFAVVWTMLRSHARERAIQRFLDAADGLERDLHDCKRRMQSLQEWVARIPGEATRQVSNMLNADASVATALKLVLSRRIWLRDQHNSASLAELKAAEENLANSRATLAENMSKLEMMREELERAADQLEMANKSVDRAKPVLVSASSHTIH